MAVRFSASGHAYTRALALGSISQFTVTCWFRIAVDRNTYSSPWGLDNGSSDFWQVTSDVNGTTMMQGDDAGPRGTGAALTVGVWYFWGISVNGAAGTRSYRAATSPTLSTETWTGGNASTNAATFRIGANSFAAEWLNGTVAAVKLWTGAFLTAAEMEAEANFYTPQRSSGLRAWYPLTIPSTVDYSGNGQTLSGGTGSVLEDGPPISWSNAAVMPLLPQAALQTEFQGWGVPI